MNCLKHSKSKYFILALLAFIFYQCSKEEKDTKGVVQVNRAVLTEKDLDSALSDRKNQGRYREEYIQNWIETEVLYQEAVKNGILDDKNYQSIIEQSKKRLAASMFLDRELSENKIDPTNDELLKYFEDYSQDFRLNNDAYEVNIAVFNNFDKAVKFRSILMESDWNKSINAFRSDPSLIRESENNIVNSSILSPVSLSKVVSNLEVNEISLVVETEPSKFSVVQLLDKFSKGVIPPFNAVRNEVKEQYLVLKRKDFIRNFIDKLVEDHNIEIKRYSE